MKIFKYKLPFLIFIGLNHLGFSQDINEIISNNEFINQRFFEAPFKNLKTKISYDSTKSYGNLYNCNRIRKEYDSKGRLISVDSSICRFINNSVTELGRYKISINYQGNDTVIMDTKSESGINGNYILIYQNGLLIRSEISKNTLYPQKEIKYFVYNHSNKLIEERWSKNDSIFGIANQYEYNEYGTGLKIFNITNARQFYWEFKFSQEYRENIRSNDNNINLPIFNRVEEHNPENEGQDGCFSWGNSLIYSIDYTYGYTSKLLNKIEKTHPMRESALYDISSLEFESLDGKVSKIIEKNCMKSEKNENCTVYHKVYNYVIEGDEIKYIETIKNELPTPNPKYNNIKLEKYYFW